MKKSNNIKAIIKNGERNKTFLESISLWVDKPISSLRFLTLESRSVLANRHHIRKTRMIKIKGIAPNHLQGLSF